MYFNFFFRDALEYSLLCEVVSTPFYIGLARFKEATKEFVPSPDTCLEPCTVSILKLNLFAEEYSVSFLTKSLEI